ncbi:hypothetical protein [Fredinandcohnia quinoae]|uniref:Uncharacterized protein n=1 Tax=Fredinandcohnia quinoae TaxID=2918902 RepID=A0AAW5E0A0_9BACI|nr:hypothetical protein [Fredinandcohnia sp. SECRCQ15]MCH1625738.1 hypothetical protein [Fredinandcohnia sp. SECRCQ15]
MFKKIMKQIKHLSQGSSERRHGHYRRGSSSDRRKGYYHRGSSSNRGYKRSPFGGSNYYKRKGRSSS